MTASIDEAEAVDVLATCVLLGSASTRLGARTVRVLEPLERLRQLHG